MTRNPSKIPIGVIIISIMCIVVSVYGSIGFARLCFVPSGCLSKRTLSTFSNALYRVQMPDQQHYDKIRAYLCRQDLQHRKNIVMFFWIFIVFILVHSVIIVLLTKQIAVSKRTTIVMQSGADI